MLRLEYQVLTPTLYRAKLTVRERLRETHIIFFFLGVILPSVAEYTVRLRDQETTTYVTVTYY